MHVIWQLISFGCGFAVGGLAWLRFGYDGMASCSRSKEDPMAAAQGSFAKTGTAQDVLVVVDMQVDFVDGALGTAEAVAIVPQVCETIRAWEGTVIVTMDTHAPEYLETQEGRHLPVVHCVRETPGWQLNAQVAEALDARKDPYYVYEKPTFGSTALAADLVAANEIVPIRTITLIGLCTDICVVSNALLIKASLPEIEVRVLPAACAGVTPAAHDAALATMASCQVQIV